MRRLFLILLSISLLMLLLPSWLIDPVRMSVVALLSPLAEATGGGRPAAMRQDDPRIREYKREIAILRNELLHKEVQLLKTRQQLKQLTRFGVTLYGDHPTRIPARVVLPRDASSWRDHLILNRGTQAGVEVGMPAVWGAFAVGIVVETSPWSCRIRAPADPESVLQVQVFPADPKGEPSVVGMLVGSPDGRGRIMNLMYIEQNTRIQIGDRVVTAGKKGPYPEGMTVGKVVEVEEEGLFYHLRVEPEILPEQAEEVFILVPFDPEEEER